jgi:hypothetical protein
MSDPIKEVKEVEGEKEEKEEKGSPCGEECSCPSDGATPSTPSSPKISSPAKDENSDENSDDSPFVFIGGGTIDLTVDTRTTLEKVAHNVMLVHMMLTPLLPWAYILCNRALQGIHPVWNVTC